MVVRLLKKIVEMENILKETGDKSIDQEFCQKLSDDFR